MMKVHVISVRKLGASEVLAGRSSGESLKAVLERLPALAVDEIVTVLDFREVELITASYFLAAFRGLWERDLFLVLANCNPEVRAEIEIALKAASLKALFGVPQEGGFAGLEAFNLDPIETSTFQRVVANGAVTAQDLYNHDRSIQPSAWSNRLAQLYRARLIQRYGFGRQLVYTPIGG